MDSLVFEKNCIVMPFKEAIDKYCRKGYDVKEKLDMLASKGRLFNNEEKCKISKELAFALKNIYEYYGRLDRAVELSERLLKNCKYNRLNMSPAS